MPSSPSRSAVYGKANKWRRSIILCNVLLKKPLQAQRKEQRCLGKWVLQRLHRGAGVLIQALHGESGDRKKSPASPEESLKVWRCRGLVILHLSYPFYLGFKIWAQRRSIHTSSNFCKLEMVSMISSEFLYFITFSIITFSNFWERKLSAQNVWIYQMLFISRMKMKAFEELSGSSTHLFSLPWYSQNLQKLTILAFLSFYYNKHELFLISNI